MTRAFLDEDLINLVPELADFTPPAHVLDKTIYSPWLNSGLHASLQQGGVDTVIVTGCETDVCVLATVMGAIDLGYRTIVVSDAVCSSADSSHDDLLDLYHRRFGEQIEAVDTAELLDAWS